MTNDRAAGASDAETGVKCGSPTILKNRPVRMSPGLLGSDVPVFESVTISSRFETTNVADACNLTPFSFLTLVGALFEYTAVLAARAVVATINKLRATKAVANFFIAVP